MNFLPFYPGLSCIISVWTEVRNISCLQLNSQQDAGQSRAAVGSGLAQGCLGRWTVPPPNPRYLHLFWRGGELLTTLLCFQVAVLNNHEQLVQLLLDKGADASVKNEVMFMGECPPRRKKCMRTVYSDL